MKLTRLISYAVIAASFSVVFADAQSFDRQPAEYPPSSYKGKQYIDSKGCVFIRAGIDGNVTWVPRVSRARIGVCGFKPTNAGTAAAAPAPSTASAPVQITLDNAPAQAARAPVAAPVRRTAAPQPAQGAAPSVVRQTAPVLRAAPAPVTVAAAPVAVPRQRQTVRATTTCPGRTGVSAQYTATTHNLPVRCGPQAEPIVGGVATGRAYAGGAVAPVTVSPDTRIVPKHVAIRRQNTTNVTVPKGYRSVWEDDRLNPRRAEQTLRGRSEMVLIWTQTAPQRLINQANGRDMTARVPLVYPYLDMATQRRELGEVTLVQRNGQVAKRIVRNRGVAPVTRKPVYSSRSTPETIVPPTAQVRVRPTSVAKAGNLVQVGLFSNQGNAQRTAQLIARMGLPARIGKVTRGGNTYMSVQAGPFGSPTETRAALGKVQSAGFGDAYTR